ncbi:MAG: 2-hydroxycarboxylate transporter family protein [Desulfovibrionaceae bacterium]
MSSSKLTIKGMPVQYFAAFFVVAVAAMFLNKLPGGMLGGFAITMALGFLFDYAGDKTPILNKYLGGGPLVCIFLSAALVYWGVMPEKTKGVIDGFMKGGGFLEFYIASLITGSILGIESRQLVRAGARYAVPLVLGLVAACVLAGVVSLVFGLGWKYGITYVTYPIMGGGLGAGVLPMSEIFAKAANLKTEQILPLLIPPMALGNVLAIICGGLLDHLGKVRPHLTGNGQLMKDAAHHSLAGEKDRELSFSALGIGLFVACCMMLVGRIAGKFIPGVHFYALAIIAVALIKIFRVLPAEIEDSCATWFKFVAKYMTAPLLVGVGVTYTNMGLVMDALTFQNVILVSAVVVGAVIGSGFGGQLVGFNFIESALSAGLCMANMGGTGDVAVLSAARRMELMPFAQISSRLGGALILIIVGVTLPFLT